MTTKIILVSFVLLLLSCQENTKKHYSNTGELLYKTYDVNKDKGIFHVKEYYKNRVLKKEGDCKDIAVNKNIPIGHWKEYYSDGVLKWEGNYINGIIQLSNKLKNGTWPDIDNLSTSLEIDGNPDSLVIGRSYKIRLIIQGINPRMYILANGNFKGLKRNHEDADRYPYIITPDRACILPIMVAFQNKDGAFLIGNPTMLLELRNIKKSGTDN